MVPLSLLHWMNTDLGDYYDKHREGVELGSFVGGMVSHPGLQQLRLCDGHEKDLLFLNHI